MKIGEVSQKTGLTKKTIRFYESEGLFAPAAVEKNGKAYRDYSEEDVEKLLRIATLRRARFTVEEIHRMQNSPEETETIFSAYRERLRQEQKDIADILSVADTIEEEGLTGPESLLQHMADAAQKLPLPKTDIHPHFRYLDDLEELIDMKRRQEKLTKEEKLQRKIAAQNATVYAALSVQNNANNNLAAGAKGFDISNAQKIAAYNMLMNNRDD